MIADQFAQAIEAAGLVPPDAIHADGALHRFSATGRRSDRAAWYVLHADGLPSGAFGCWRSGLTETWSSKPQTEQTAQERAELRRRVQQAKAQRDQEQMQRQQQAQQTAHARWEAATPTRWHQYTRDKGVQPHGLNVIIPALPAI